MVAWAEKRRALCSRDALISKSLRTGLRWPVKLMGEVKGEVSWASSS